MKVILRIYQYKETVERECSSAEEASQIAESMSAEDPDLLVERYIELDTNYVVDMSGFEQREAQEA
jgi:hypothetical protein